ncbi:hypothetical protein L917_11951 [Phytophthora nicotianae]|uniref:Myb/SANT-like domain-containing protein n=1 Tax=Phytophthora nicotianae TaxID=4792 RepID=W2KV92_PHYNI|nr:hypothetical protein L917_11951 [Phytophthora nicotianae]
MLDASGFGWDDERHVVLVHDSVWDDYVKASPMTANADASSSGASGLIPARVNSYSVRLSLFAARCARFDKYSPVRLDNAN